MFLSMSILVGMVLFVKFPGKAYRLDECAEITDPDINVFSSNEFRLSGYRRSGDDSLQTGVGLFRTAKFLPARRAGECPEVVVWSCER